MSSNSSLLDANGAMSYKIQETCDSWATETQVRMEYIYQEKQVVESLWNFESRESKDGQSYSFFLTQNDNGLDVERLSGNVLKGMVRLTNHLKSHRMEFNLPDGTIFPIKHLQLLLNRVQRKDKIFFSRVFDGGGKDKLFNINSIIIDRDAKKRDYLVDNNSGIYEKKVLIQMAYFLFSGVKEEPDFELSVHLRDNGVADKIIQNFGDIVLSLDVKSIKFLPAKKC